MTDNIKSIYLGNLTAKRGPDGFMYVKGLATDDTLDLDQQICDPKWLKSAMPKWMEIGNIREMHAAKAVGKATEMQQTGSGFVVTAKVVDEQAAKMVEEGIYTGFSVGIKGARVVKDDAAPGGRIVDGTIVEVSLVDRPANPSAVIEIAKSVDGALVKGAAVADVEKAESPEQNAELVATEEPGVADEVLDRDQPQPCQACSGTGKKTNVDGNTQETDCEVCNGSGHQPEGRSENHLQNSPTNPQTRDNRDIKDAEPELVKEYNPDQPRGEHGRWGAGGMTQASKDIKDDPSSTPEEHKDASNSHREIAAGLRDAASKSNDSDRASLFRQAATVHDLAANAHADAAKGYESSGAANRLSGEAYRMTQMASEAITENQAPGLYNQIFGEPDKAADADTEKRTYTDQERQVAAASGHAMPSGSFPVNNVKDLKNAIRAIGRAKDPEAAKSHIKARAKALGHEEMVPDNWKGADAETTKAAEDMNHDAAELEQIRLGLINCIKAELDEMLAGDDNETCDVEQLLCTLKMFLDWWTDEASENQTEAPFTGWDNDQTGDTMAYIGLGVSADLIKNASADTATTEVKDELRSEIVKALGLEEVMTAKAELSKATEEIELLKAALDEVKSMAAPGGPALRATREQTSKSAAVLANEVEAMRLRNLAKQITDPALRNQYLETARALEANN